MSSYNSNVHHLVEGVKKLDQGRLRIAFHSIDVEDLPELLREEDISCLEREARKLIQLQESLQRGDPLGGRQPNEGKLESRLEEMGRKIRKLDRDYLDKEPIGCSDFLIGFVLDLYRQQEELESETRDAEHLENSEDWRRLSIDELEDLYEFKDSTNFHTVCVDDEEDDHVPDLEGFSEALGDDEALRIVLGSPNHDGDKRYE